MNKIEELGFIIGNVYFEKDEITYKLSEEYKKELKEAGVPNLTKILNKLWEDYETKNKFK